MKDWVKGLIGLLLCLFALGGIAKIVHGGPLDVGPGDVGKMAVWEVASLSWKPWTTLGYGLVSQLSVGKGEVARLAYWNGTAWTAWTGTVPSTWLTGGNWKTFYTNGTGVMQELALPAAYYYFQGNGAAAAPSFVNALRPARITTTTGSDTLKKTYVLDSLFAITGVMGNLIGGSSYFGWSAGASAFYTPVTIRAGTFVVYNGSNNSVFSTTGIRSNIPGYIVKVDTVSTDSIRMNKLGGLDVRAYNNSGATIYRGWIMKTKTGNYKGVEPVVTSDLQPVGTVHDASAATATWFWMTVSGAGYVAVIDAPTATVINGDRLFAVSTATNGLADCYTTGAVPVHDREIGHVFSDGIIGQNTSPSTDNLAVGIIHFR
jgi:hypothetical protein